METGFWNMKAKKYPRPFSAGQQAETKRVISMLKAKGVSFADADVLDVGCGTGAYALPLAAEARRVMCLDISENMLSVLKEEADANGIRNVETRLTPFSGFAHDPGGFDVVLASMTPAVRTGEDVARMEVLSRGWCVYIGWAGRREDPLSDELMSAHGVRPFVPDGAANIRGVLRARGREFSEEAIETSWIWRGSPAEAAEDFDARVRLEGLEPAPGLSEKMLRERFPGGRVIMTTRASEAVIVWRRN